MDPQGSSGSSEIRCQAEKMTESKGGIPKAPACDLHTLIIPKEYALPFEIDISLSSDCMV